MLIVVLSLEVELQYVSQRKGMAEHTPPRRPTTSRNIEDTVLKYAYVLVYTAAQNMVRNKYLLYIQILNISGHLSTAGVGGSGGVHALSLFFAEWRVLQYEQQPTAVCSCEVALEFKKSNVIVIEAPKNKTRGKIMLWRPGFA